MNRVFLPVLPLYASARTAGEVPGRYAESEMACLRRSVTGDALAAAGAAPGRVRVVSAAVHNGPRQIPFSLGKAAT